MSVFEREIQIPSFITACIEFRFLLYFYSYKYTQTDTIRSLLIYNWVFYFGKEKLVSVHSYEVNKPIRNTRLPSNSFQEQLFSLSFIPTT